MPMPGSAEIELINDRAVAEGQEQTRYTRRRALKDRVRIQQQTTASLDIPLAGPDSLAAVAQAVLAREEAAILAPKDVAEARENITSAAAFIADSKPTNPKDIIGSDKIPFHLWPETASILGSLGLLEGALKYGRANWREAGVRASIYYDALRRHMNAWFEGEDADPDSGLPHEAHMLACIAIIIDAKAAGKFVDDRQYRGRGYRAFIDKMTAHVKRIKAKYADRAPKHWTIQDNKD